MRVAILKGDSPRHNYFADQLKFVEGVEFLVVGHNRLKGGRLKKMLIKSPLTFISRVSKYMLYFLWGWAKYEAHFFGQTNAETDLRVNSFNSKSSISLFQKFNPDLILAFGIPIISRKVIAIPRLGAINLHGGISPEYKGGNTIFWALFNNEVHLAGATIHYMVQNVDSGRVISKVYPDIETGDNELSVSCKTFRDASHEMVKILKWIMQNESRVPGVEQTSKGNLYLAKNRNFVKDIQGIFLIRKHLLKADFKSKVERYYPGNA